MADSEFSIDAFWCDRIAPQIKCAELLPKGWHQKQDGLETFLEAPLMLSEKFAGEAIDPRASIILVSAPGAVGKSTLAKQISYRTGATYIDLAEAEPVGGHTLSGGLAKSRLYTHWHEDDAVVLIDGLDEARIKVTQESFEAFLGDVAELSSGRAAPTVLFGRSGAIEEAWLHLGDSANICVLEIGYYDAEKALKFAQTHFDAANPEDPHRNVAHEAIKLLLNRLREDTQDDEDRFVGYAPVLKAVAERVSGEPNHGVIVANAKAGGNPVTLQSIVNAILEREQAKLSQITFEDPSLSDVLYAPKEQLQRLSAQIFGLSPPSLPPMSANDTRAYAEVLQTWVPEHPFLDGGARASSSVFEAAVTAFALLQAEFADAALNTKLNAASVNPFLASFYFDAVSGRTLAPEHVGLIYASIRAGLSLGDTASLAIEGKEDGDDGDELESIVEMVTTRHGSSEPVTLEFGSVQVGTLKLGSRLEDIDVVAPLMRVEIGGARDAILVAPVNVQCDRVALSSSRLVIEGGAADEVSSAVHLEADKMEESAIASPPILNGGVSLSVSWPGAEIYPWTGFHVAAQEHHDPRVAEALRRFRKFVISFRSHSKGSLERYAPKLEHARMTKGVGRTVLDHMLTTGVLSLNHPMYVLDPSALRDVAGASYENCMAQRYSDRTVTYVASALG